MPNHNLIIINKALVNILGSFTVKLPQSFINIFVKRAEYQSKFMFYAKMAFMNCKNIIKYTSMEQDSTATNQSVTMGIIKASRSDSE